jgi:hypothetical protein
VEIEFAGNSSSAEPSDWVREVFVSTTVLLAPPSVDDAHCAAGFSASEYVLPAVAPANGMRIAPAAKAKTSANPQVGFQCFR